MRSYQDIFPQTKHGTYLGEPLRLVLVIEAHAGFVDVVIPRGAEPDQFLRMQQGNLGNSIVTYLQTEGMVHRGPEPGRAPGLGGVAAHHDPPVSLLELVSVDWIVQVN
jgi:hypothetical protein